MHNIDYIPYICDFRVMENALPQTHLRLQIHDTDLPFIKDSMHSTHTSSIQVAFVLPILQHPIIVRQRKQVSTSKILAAVL